MQTYENLSGTSGVQAFEIGFDYIRVRFTDGEVYKYSSESTGPEAIERMKELAVAGRGLNTYINQVVRGRFELKEPRVGGDGSQGAP